MSLATPERIRTLRRKLYRKAKAEPAFRFYLLYDKIHRDDILEQAYALARSNGGAPGVDGRSFAAIEAAGLTEWLAGIRKERTVMTRLGLALNEAKTAIRDARRERFDFLGYTFGPHHYRKDGHWYLGASPSKKSVR